jgi:hypothetical protein
MAFSGKDEKASSGETGFARSLPFKSGKEENEGAAVIRNEGA